MQVLPDYRKSVYNIPHTLMKFLGMQDSQALDNFRDLHTDSLIFILVDAFGYTLFERYLKDEFKGEQEKLTSLFPSTTSAVLTTLYTGLSPKEHGILEWYMYYEEFGGIIKTLPFSPMNVDENDYLKDLGISPEPLFALPTIFQRMKDAGIRSSTYMRREYAHASYSTYLLRGSEIKEYYELKDAFANMEKDKSDFVYLYIDYLDTVEHAYGPDSRETMEELRGIFSYIERLVKRRNDTTIVISADHGQIEIKNKKILKFKNSLVGGSPRDVFVYGRDEIPERMRSIPKRDFLHLLGPGNENPRLKTRLPEIILLPEEYQGVWYQDFYARGLHGGLSPLEMYVPFLIFN